MTCIGEIVGLHKMTRSWNIRGLAGQLQLGRDTWTFSGESLHIWPYPQNVTDKTKDKLKVKNSVSRENVVDI